MATKSVPVPPTPVSGGYQKENNTFSDVTGVYRAANTPSIRMSKNSPPLVGVDANEGQMIMDKTSGKLHIIVNGVLKTITLT
jgi:hypothetical protein